MSIRDFSRCMLILAICLLALAPLRAQEEEAQEEEELDLKTMVQEIKTQLAEQKESKVVLSKVKFPFGHFASRAAPPPDNPGMDLAPLEPQGPIGLPDFKITGKMRMGNQYKIFVGRGAFGVGDTVEGCKILAITGESVSLEYSGQKFEKSIP